MEGPDVIVIGQRMNPKIREITFTVDESIVIIVNEIGFEGDRGAVHHSPDLPISRFTTTA